MTNFPTYEDVAQLLQMPNFSLIPYGQGEENRYLEMIRDGNDAWFKFAKWDVKERYFENPRIILNYMNTPLVREDKWSNSYLVEKTETGAYVGEFNLDFYKHDVTLGYFVAPSWRRQRIATNLCIEIIDALKKNATLLDITSIKAEVLPNNEASLRVLKNTGFNNLGLRVYSGGNQPLNGELLVHFDIPLKPQKSHTPRHSTLRLKR